MSQKIVPKEAMSVNEDEDLQVGRRKRKKQDQEGRNRASPARLVRINAALTKYQRDLIAEYDLGGLLKIGASSMPADLSRWVTCEVHIVPSPYQYSFIIFLFLFPH